jgi:hypothetical protein
MEEGGIMTGKISHNLIEVRQGDSFVMDFEIKKGCKPVDLTGASLVMQVKDNAGNTIFSVNGEMVDAVNGKIAIVLTPIETSKPVGEYKTDIQLTTRDGSVNTIFPADIHQVATFVITEQVTR